MTVRPSPEIESVMTLVIDAWNRRDSTTLSNLYVHDESFLGIGTDAGEWWPGGNEFLAVHAAQFQEMPAYEIEVEQLETRESGSLGWCATRGTLSTPSGRHPLRITAIFILGSGVWRIVQWHASLGTTNEQLWGFEITTTLDELLASVSEDPSLVSALGGSEGTMTLVFTDIADSTQLNEAMGDPAWVALLGKHESTITEITEAHLGNVCKMLGDGAMLAFESVRAAVRASIEIQQALRDEPFSVRIGVHTGDVLRTEDDLLGLTASKAARVAAAAAGGTIMVSVTVRDLVGSQQGISFGEPILAELKGLAGTHQLVPIDWQ